MRLKSSHPDQDGHTAARVYVAFAAGDLQDLRSSRRSGPQSGSDAYECSIETLPKVVRVFEVPLSERSLGLVDYETHRQQLTIGQV